MKTFNLAIATLAIATAVSGSAFAANTDSYGNIPNHDNDKVAAYNDSTNGYESQTVRPASELSNRDALLLQLNIDRDNGSKSR